MCRASGQQPMRGGGGRMWPDGGSHRWVVSRGLASELVAECGSGILWFHIHTE